MKDEQSDYDDTLEAFDRFFKAWVGDMQPSGDTSALRAIAWYWYSRGNDTAVERIGSKCRSFHHSLASNLVTEHGRLMAGVEPYRPEQTQ